MSNAKYHLSPEQLAAAEKKRLRRQAKRSLTRENPSEPSKQPQFLARPWVSLSDSCKDAPGDYTVKVMTWNILAQCLMRSELFPTSGKARKAAERGRMIYDELVFYDADVMCLQEADRQDKLFPILKDAGYFYTYAAGPLKPHGCVIAYKQDMFRIVGEKVIQYDNLEVRENVTISSQARIASSHRTTNIGSLVALERVGTNRAGYIVATTHLFWHPAYTYERARQAGLLLREVIGWRDHMQLCDWPCIISGAADFNFSPEDPAYSLLVGDPLSAEQKHSLDVSRVVHVSIDSSVPKSSTTDGEEGEEGDPDRIIRDSRVAEVSDGLLSDSELLDLFRHPLRSAYDEGQRMRKAVAKPSDVVTFGDRIPLSTARLGANEPMWTSYTHYWKTTLDYIFFLDSPRTHTKVIGYLQPHHTENVAQGLPQLQICGSDHFSLCAKLMTSISPCE
ncbi:Endonuclease/exonuclease/phosphatase [Pisolithus croceorrhizus]|nr:Endonuclease/exonuclease/phosphatase [Pisolithus croceorrhizus]